MTRTIEVQASLAIHQNCQFSPAKFSKSYIPTSIDRMGYYLGPIVEFL